MRAIEKEKMRRRSAEGVMKRKGARGSGNTETGGEGEGQREEVRAEEREAGVAENERVIRLIFQHREILPLNH